MYVWEDLEFASSQSAAPAEDGPVILRARGACAGGRVQVLVRDVVFAPIRQRGELQPEQAKLSTCLSHQR